MTERVPVFVCGDPTRGDDGAAAAAVALLAPAARARADVVEAGALDLLFLLDLPADRPCVVVDAVAGLAPGQVWVRPLAALVERARRLEAAGRAVEPRSSHELPLEQVLALAATLREQPPTGTFVGIGGGQWDPGSGLSGAVAAGLPAFAAAIEAAIEAASRPAAASDATTGPAAVDEGTTGPAAVDEGTRASDHCG